jgi:hypothetical protein
MTNLYKTIKEASAAAKEQNLTSANNYAKAYKQNSSLPSRPDEASAAAKKSQK